MTRYVAPLEEQLFALEVAAGLLSPGAPGQCDMDMLDVARAVLEQSGRLAEEVFAPLNRRGDIEGARLHEGEVVLPAGFAEAYDQYQSGGWSALAAPVAEGGEGLPFVVAAAMQEQFCAANTSLSLCMMLGQGAIAALRAFGSEELRQRYLPKLVSGEWAGTMNLTEPQAGSDVGALRTRAELHADGTYRIQGTKIFITFGDHPLTDNIMHLVLARLPGAPAGTKGISLFLVPKLLPDGRRNDLRCVSIEEKLGLHGSPTCAMSYGDGGACVGLLVGQENHGMRAMFAMMNHARINVGLQGVGLAECATQAAVAYARERVQGRRIIEFPDVRRMIMTMRAQTQAARALSYYNAAAVDLAEASGDGEAGALADLLTPMTKAFCSDVGVEVTGLSLQVHGGMGYIEETGIAQLCRDARIAPIYEGTNGIQAIDLVSRKLPQRRWEPLFEQIAQFAGDHHASLRAALGTLGDATAWLMENPSDAKAGATPYLRMFSLVVAGYLLARQAAAARERLASGGSNTAFLEAKLATSDFFLEQLLPAVSGLYPAVIGGERALFAIPEEQLAAW